MKTATLWVDARCTLGEGITWCEGRHALLWTDIQESQLWMHAHGADSARTWSLPDRLGSFALCESGKLLLGLAKQLCLADIDAARDAEVPGGAETLAITPLVSVEGSQPSTRVNDGRTDRSGNFVFGTLNEVREKAPLGAFYQFSWQRGLRRLGLGAVVTSNSICFSPDGTTMYYCDTRERRIMQCDYDADEASVANIREFVRFDANQGFPDGSVIDADGCLWNAEWRGAIVRRYTPQGSIDREIAVPAKNPTCVAFGGPDLDQLYITSARQQMNDEELARTPEAGGVYQVVPDGVRGLPDRKFKDR